MVNNIELLNKYEGAANEEILNYLLRDMQHVDGGFYCAEDADVDGEEGAYYIWDYKEIIELIPPDDIDLFCEYFDITTVGNFKGKNVLYRTLSIEEFSELRDIDPRSAQVSIHSCLKILYQARQKRKRPFKDDKVLVSWNAMAIDTLIKAGCALQNDSYIQSGLSAAIFIRQNLWKEGKLLRRFREGQTDHDGGFDDYAYLIRALITLFEADLGAEWLEWALELTEFLEEEFKAEEGAFYQTGPKHSILLRRPEVLDGSHPSGNAIHANNLIRLSQITHNREYRIQAEDILKVATSYIENYPQGSCCHLSALEHYFDKSASTVIVALSEEEAFKREITEILSQAFKPNRAVIWRRQSDAKLLKILPHLEENVSIENQTTVYICKQGKCEKPLTQLETIRSRFT